MFGEREICLPGKHVTARAAPKLQQTFKLEPQLRCLARDDAARPAPLPVRRLSNVALHVTIDLRSRFGFNACFYLHLPHLYITLGSSASGAYLLAPPIPLSKHLRYPYGRPLRDYGAQHHALTAACILRVHIALRRDGCHVCPSAGADDGLARRGRGGYG